MISVPAKLDKSDVLQSADGETINLMDWMGESSKMNLQLRSSAHLQALGYESVWVFPSVCNASKNSWNKISSHLVKECASQGF